MMYAVFFILIIIVGISSVSFNENLMMKELQECIDHSYNCGKIVPPKVLVTRFYW